MASPQGTPEKPASRRKRLALILAASVLLLGGGGVVGYLRFGRGKLAGGDAAPLELHPGVAVLEPFTLNLPDEGGDRYLRVALRVVLDSPDAAHEINLQGAAYTRLRDRILSVLAAGSTQELVTREGREELRAAITRAIAPQLEKAEVPGRVLHVYFTEFLIQ